MADFGGSKAARGTVTVPRSRYNALLRFALAQTRVDRNATSLNENWDEVVAAFEAKQRARDELSAELSKDAA